MVGLVGHLYCLRARLIKRRSTVRAAARAKIAGLSNDIRNPASGDTENPATPVTPVPRPEPAWCRA